MAKESRARGPALTGTLVTQIGQPLRPEKNKGIREALLPEVLPDHYVYGTAPHKAAVSMLVPRARHSYTTPRESHYLTSAVKDQGLNQVNWIPGDLLEAASGSTRLLSLAS